MWNWIRIFRSLGFASWGGSYKIKTIGCKQLSLLSSEHSIVEITFNRTWEWPSFVNRTKTTSSFYESAGVGGGVGGILFDFRVCLKIRYHSDTDFSSWNEDFSYVYSHLWVSFLKLLSTNFLLPLVGLVISSVKLHSLYVTLTNTIIVLLIFFSDFDLPFVFIYTLHIQFCL